MKIKRGDHHVTVPDDFDCMIGVELEFDDCGVRYALAEVSNQVVHDLYLKHPDLVARPVYFTIGGMTVGFWPSADQDYELKIKYFPHRKEI